MRQPPFLALVLVAAAPLGAAARAATVPAPSLAPGDNWTYENGKEVGGSRRTSHDTMTLTRVDGRLLTVNVRPAGSDAPGREMLANPDWSRTRSVDGRQTVVNRPLVFPLAPGKTWSLDYTETTPADRRHTRERLEMTYRVAGWEDVTVAAGTFHVLRIEGDGTWTAELPANTVIAAGRAPNGGNFAVTSKQPGRVASGRFLKTFWYAPEVHRWVRSEESFYDNNGVRTEQDTSSLEAYTVAEARAAEESAQPPKPARAHRAKPAKDAAAKDAAAKDAASEDAPAAATGRRVPKPAHPAPDAPQQPLLQELRFVVPPAAPATPPRGSL